MKIKTLFWHSGSITPAFREAFSRAMCQEFFNGDLALEDCQKCSVLLERYLDYPFSLTGLQTSLGISFRRSIDHIRQDQVGGARVLWFVREGTLHLTRSKKSYRVSAGEWGVTDADEPKTIRLSPETGGNFSANQVTMPAHLFHSHIGGASAITEGFKLESDGNPVVNELLQLLLNVGDRLNREAAEYLCHAFLASIGSMLRDRLTELAHHQRTIDQRFNQIEDCIVKNMTNANLNHAQVARDCGISPRYLCRVLKAHGTSFSEMLWTQRLYRARDWLHALGYRHQPIGRLALMAGFKSSAHFSRMFRKEFGISPRDYRNLVMESPQRINHIGRSGVQT